MTLKPKDRADGGLYIDMIDVKASLGTTGTISMSRDITVMETC